MKMFKIFWASLKAFYKDDCYLKASALTFYTLFSIVPTLAVALGIAKGFGFEHSLENLLRSNFREYESLVTNVISFAHKALEKTTSGWIAGVGVFVLFWTVISLLSSIETTFNQIWKVDTRRTIARTVIDYIALTIIFPLFFVATSSMTVYIASQIVKASEYSEFIHTITPALFMGLRGIVLVLCWAVFSFAYMYIPNTRVSLKAGIIGGIIAGTVYQLLQWGYIHFQFKLTNYSAIYGSFAALPLFLLWVQLSWLVVLWGAELTYFCEKHRATDYLRSYSDASFAAKKRLALFLTYYILRGFKNGDPPFTATQLAEKLGTTLDLVHEILKALVDEHILTETVAPEGMELTYLPSIDPSLITVSRIYDALEEHGNPKPYLSVKNEELAPVIQKIEDTKKRFDLSDGNFPLL